jgi:hypothetical protein
MIPVVIGGVLLAGLAYAALRGVGVAHKGPPVIGGALYAPVAAPVPGMSPPLTTEEALAYNVVMPFPAYDAGLVPSSSQRSTSR